MNILEKIELGKEHKTYQRIDSSYRVNIFLGYNENGQMSLVITEYGHPKKVSSSKVIELSFRQREDGKLALSFDLLDPTYKSIFLVFCKDIITVCETAGPEKAVAMAINRWQYWRAMFGKKPSRLLSLSEIKGLVGELIELRDFFIPKYGALEALNGWRGPLLGHKDYELDGTWYEIKCINDSANQVIISSLEQLDSDIDGHLSIVRLEETSSSASSAFNINQLVLDLMKMIEEHDLLKLFQSRLENVGFMMDPEYEEFYFRYKGTQRYCVDQHFPRLVRNNVHPSIGNVKYTILLDGIVHLKEN